MGVGRHTKCTPEAVSKICELIETDSYSVKDICKKVGITTTSYFEWINVNPEFSAAIKKAKEKYLDTIAIEAEKSLVKLVRGYSVQEKQTVTIGSGKYDANGNEIPKIKEQKIIEKHFQPNTAAVIFSLTNRDSANWKNRLNSEVTGADGKDLVPNITLEVIDSREQVRVGQED